MSKPPIDSDEEIRKPHEVARVDALRDHNHTVSQQDSDKLTLENGRIALSYKNPNDSLSARKKKDEKAIRFALKMINLTNRLYEIDMRLNEIHQMQQGINRQLEAIQKGDGVELDVNGKLQDKDAEKALQEYEKKHGAKVDRTNPDAVYHALLLYNQELNAENHQLTEERDEVQDQLDDLSQIQNPPVEEVNNLLHQGINLDFRQVKIQENKNIEDTSQYNADRGQENHVLNIHDEIASFMKAHARVKEIDDPQEQMMKKQKMVEGLSQEAKEQLSMTEEIEHIFEPGYFDSLHEPKPVLEGKSVEIMDTPSDLSIKT